MTNGVEHLFIYLLAINIYTYFKKCLDFLNILKLGYHPSEWDNLFTNDISD